MDATNIHRARSADGTEIAGRVYGDGPPLVLVHGAMDDGEGDWGSLVPCLADTFTCYVPATRGRGLSGNHADHSLERLVDDVTAFIDSIGEPVGVMGLSSGGMLSLGAAARSSAVAAIAVHEPIAFEVMDEETSTRFGETVERMAEAAAAGRPLDAARAFFELVCNGDELSKLSAPESLEVAARNLAVDLEEFEGAVVYAGGGPTDPANLARIAAPLLVLHGTKTALSWFSASAQHVTEHVPGAESRRLEGAGHLAPAVEPVRVAREVIPFFSRAFVTV